MKGFIEVTDKYGGPMLVNVQHITSCVASWTRATKNKEEYNIDGTCIDFEDAEMLVLEDYETICSMIEEAQKG